MAGVEAREAVYLMPVSAVLIARLQQLPPYGVERLMVLQQQPRVPVFHCLPLSTQQRQLLLVLQQRLRWDFTLLESPLQALDLQTKLGST